jgi:hypothetical protein
LICNHPRKLDAKVYRMDLMKFSLLRRILGGITQINKAGIRPDHGATMELGDGKDYPDRTPKPPLPLKEDAPTCWFASAAWSGSTALASMDVRPARLLSRLDLRHLCRSRSSALVVAGRLQARSRATTMKREVRTPGGRAAP